MAAPIATSRAASIIPSPLSGSVTGATGISGATSAAINTAKSTRTRTVTLAALKMGATSMSADTRRNGQ